MELRKLQPRPTEKNHWTGRITTKIMRKEKTNSCVTNEVTQILLVV